MSEQQWDATPPWERSALPAVEQKAPMSDALRSGLTDAAVVLAWFAAAGLIAAVVWWQVTPLAEFTRVGQGGSMDEEQLSRQFGANGWFVVIAAVGGLVSGLVLSLLRRKNPLLLVALLAVGGALATWLMVSLGLSLGPADPTAVLPTVAEGGTAALQLKADAHAVWFVWSIAALAGAAAVMLLGEARDTTPTPGYAPYEQQYPPYEQQYPPPYQQPFPATPVPAPAPVPPAGPPPTPPGGLVPPS